MNADHKIQPVAHNERQVRNKKQFAYGLQCLLDKVPTKIDSDLKDKYKQRLERSVLRSLGNLFG